ncbi:Jag N-terminal domain-containing protein [Brevibacillus migulae]|uniref:Jag N-terminal domain-containing protein n=1 Tax=Brevibacillus migulae TaxID=1644114 RepID=UPI001430AE91|nr:Jag N-terminal domain-containing protein [Brevibacillus migulae]
MSRSVVAKGKTVPEAVELALQLLSATREQVDIEILEMETKGIFGIGGKPAVVKVVVKDNHTEAAVQKGSASEAAQVVTDTMEILMNTIDGLELSDEGVGFAPNPPSIVPEGKEGLEGMVWVKDGQIFCRDGVNKYPTVTTCPEVILYKNDEQVKGTVLLSEKDKLRVEVLEEMTPSRWEIHMETEKLKAHLKVRPGTRISRRLVDQEADDHLDLFVEESVRTVNDININDVYDKLADLGIVQGINHQEIRRACESQPLKRAKSSPLYAPLSKGKQD